MNATPTTKENTMHTQTPWRKVEVGIIQRPLRLCEHIAIRPLAGPTLAFLPYSSRSTKESQIENAALIVKAVNSYEAMRAAIQTTLRVLRQMRDECPAQWDALVTPEISSMWDQNKAALAIAEGKE